MSVMPCCFDALSARLIERATAATRDARFELFETGSECYAKAFFFARNTLADTLGFAAQLGICVTHDVDYDRGCLRQERLSQANRAAQVRGSA